MYEEFYQLKEKPFSLTPDTRFLFLSEDHRAALEHLQYGIKEKEGFILITGEVGTGKTTLCRALIDKIDSSVTDSALILNPMFSGQELLQCILGDFGVRTGARTKKELLDELNEFLLRQQTLDRHSLLIIDEAQNLSLPVLEEIRILSNLETEKEKLLQIILMGQNELRQKLALPQLRQLNQRISIRYHLGPLRKEELERYIQHRLTVAGSSGDIHFTAGAMREIQSYSQGIPRLVNLAADRALLAGYVQQSRVIRRHHVISGVKSLEGVVITLAHGFWRRMLTQGLTALVVFLLGVFAAFFVQRNPELLRRLWIVGKNTLWAQSDRMNDSQASTSEKASFYTLEVGAYDSEREALEMARRVRATGFPVYLSKGARSGGEGVHRLYLGKFAEKKKAEELEKTFKMVEGFSGVKVVVTYADASERANP